jgi:hypothetical protein
MSNLQLVRFCQDYGRMGDVEGLFITTEDKMKQIMGTEVYFGEILGKHSSVSVTIDEEVIEIMSEKQDFINEMLDELGGRDIFELVGYCTISGHNPFDYI